MRIGKATLLTLILYVLHKVVVELQHTAIPKLEASNFLTPKSSITALLFDALVMGTVLWYLIKVKALEEIKNQFKNARLSHCVIGVLLGALTVLLLKTTTRIFYFLFHNNGDFNFSSGHIEFEPFHIIDIVALAVLVPIFEEILFRGHIQTQLENRYNSYLAIFVTSILFGLYHSPNWLQVWTATLFGMYIGVIHTKSKNIMIAIMWHITWNGLIVFSKYYNIF